MYVTQCVAVTCPVAVIKRPGKGNLRKEGFALVYGCQQGIAAAEEAWLVTLYPQLGSPQCQVLLPPLPPPFIQPGTQAQGMAPACSKVTLPTQVNLIKTTPQRCDGMCLLGDSRSHQVGDQHKPSPNVFGSREDSH